MAGMYCLKDLLKLAEAEEAEELRLEPGQAPAMVVRGWRRVLDLPPLTSDDVTALFRSFAGQERLEELRRCGDARFQHAFEHAKEYAVIATTNRESLTVRLRRLGR